jgi:hypothetical protein
MSHPARGPIGTMGIDGKDAPQRGAGAPLCGDATAEARVEPAALERLLPGRTYPLRGQALLRRPRANAADRRHAGVKICDDLTEAAA